MRTNPKMAAKPSPTVDALLAGVGAVGVAEVGTVALVGAEVGAEVGVTALWSSSRPTVHPSSSAFKGPSRLTDPLLITVL